MPPAHPLTWTIDVLEILVINFILFCIVQEGPDCVLLFQIEANEFNCQDQINSLILNMNDS